MHFHNGRFIASFETLYSKARFCSVNKVKISSCWKLLLLLYWVKISYCITGWNGKFQTSCKESPPQPLPHEFRFYFLSAIVLLGADVAALRSSLDLLTRNFFRSLYHSHSRVSLCNVGNLLRFRPVSVLWRGPKFLLKRAGKLHLMMSVD
jgi:hypothetical protein